MRNKVSRWLYDLHWNLVDIQGNKRLYNIISRIDEDVLERGKEFKLNLYFPVKTAWIEITSNYLPPDTRTLFVGRIRTKKDLKMIMHLLKIK